MEFTTCHHCGNQGFVLNENEYMCQHCCDAYNAKAGKICRQIYFDNIKSHLLDIGFFLGKRNIIYVYVADGCDLETAIKYACHF